MQIITATELRTKSKDLITALLAGDSVDLVHRSKIVGEFKPKQGVKKTLNTANIKEIIRLAKSIDLPKMNDTEIGNRYRKGLEKKYGKNLS